MNPFRQTISSPVLIVILMISLSACESKKSEPRSGVTSAPVADARDNEDKEGSLPLHLRLAFMTGHVEAGLELYRLGELEMAAPHLLHPISETHKAERLGLQKLGLDVVSFVAVSAALEAKRPAYEIEPLLSQAETNLKMLANRAGGNSSEIIIFLLNMIVEEYSVAVTKGSITDIGEYQDAYGFHSVARFHANKLPETIRSEVVSSLDIMKELWVDGPRPTSVPTSEQVMASAASNIIKIIEK